MVLHKTIPWFQIETRLPVIPEAGFFFARRTHSKCTEFWRLKRTGKTSRCNFFPFRIVLQASRLPTSLESLLIFFTEER